VKGTKTEGTKANKTQRTFDSSAFLGLVASLQDFLPGVFDVVEPAGSSLSGFILLLKPSLAAFSRCLKQAWLL
jgi:hypothetical protein